MAGAPSRPAGRVGWPSTPLATAAPSSRPRSTSLPLVETVIYRPGPWLALTLLLAPILSALVGAAVYIGLNGAVPLWLPLLLLLWIPLFAAIWFALRSVRYGAENIAAARPWQRWTEIALDDVEAVELRGAYLRLYDTNHRVISFAPALLQDGQRLRRQLLLRLPQRVLDDTLRQEAQRLSGAEPLREEQLIGSVRMRPRLRWAGLTLLMALGCIGAGVVAWVFLPLAAGIPLAAIAAVAAVLLLALAFWLRQEISVDEKGLQVRPFLVSQRHYVMWSDVELILAERHELTLNLRGLRSLRCAGPMLFRSHQRNQLRAYIRVYCGQRNVQVIQLSLARWFFSRVFTVR